MVCNPPPQLRLLVRILPNKRYIGLQTIIGLTLLRPRIHLAVSLVVLRARHPEVLILQLLKMGLL